MSAALLLAQHPTRAAQPAAPQVAYLDFDQHYEGDLPDAIHLGACISKNPIVQRLITAADRKANQGAYAEAIDLYQQALTALNVRQEPDVAGTLEYNLGYELTLQGKRRDAIPHLRAALIYQTDPMRVAIDQLGLGLALHEEGQSIEAETLLAAGLASYTQFFGARDPMRLHLSRLLSQLEMRNGKASAAAARMRIIAPLDASVFGPEHFEAPRAYYLLALTLYVSGEKSEAAASGQKSVELWRGNAHAAAIELADVAEFTGSLLNELKEGASAEKALQIALPLLEKFRPQSPALTLGLAALARAQMLQGKYLEAGTNYEKALQVREQLSPPLPEDSVLADTYTGLASVAFFRADYSLAAVDYQNAWRIRRTVLGDHFDTAATGDQLGRTLCKLHRAQEARQVLEQVLAMRNRMHESDPEGMIITLHYLGLSNGMEKRPQVAEPYYRKALDLDTTLKLNSPEVGYLAYDYGAFLVAQKRISEARQQLTSALPLLERAEGPNTYAVGQAADLLGLIYIDLAKPDLAEPQFRRAWSILKITGGISVRAVAAGLSLSAALEAEKKFPEAESVLEEVHREALSRNETRPQSVLAAAYLARVLTHMHQTKKAQVFLDEIRARCSEADPNMAEACHSWNRKS